MSSTWPEEPGYHWVTHNDSSVTHVAKAAEALNREVPDIAAAQAHATIAQAEATLVVVHTLRDIMGRLQEQTVAVENLQRTVRQVTAGHDGDEDDPLLAPEMVYAQRADPGLEM
ncbi:MAG: hypothetical protein ACRDP6_12835 [Actinoallomurus sp.]